MILGHSLWDKHYGTGYSVVLLAVCLWSKRTQGGGKNLRSKKGKLAASSERTRQKQTLQNAFLLVCLSVHTHTHRAQPSLSPSSISLLVFFALTNAHSYRGVEKLFRLCLCPLFPLLQNINAQFDTQFFTLLVRNEMKSGTHQLLVNIQKKKRHFL